MFHLHQAKYKPYLQKLCDPALEWEEIKMSSSGMKNIIKYVLPMILSNVCFFMFTIIDAVFVGRGVGTNALGAINLVSPFIMVVGAINMLISVGLRFPACT